jgi:hypothetical protein
MSEQAGRVEVTYAWHAVGAAGYLVLISGTETEPTSGRRLFQDTSGVLISDIDLFPGRPETTLVRIWALDTAATAFFAPLSSTDPRPGNISGALGLFAAAAVLDPPKVVLWQ